MDKFNALSNDEAETLLLRCCASPSWARAMCQRRPFSADYKEMRDYADDCWWNLDTEQWLAAFTAHPRIGEKKAASAAEGKTAGWEGDEQKGAANAASNVLALLTQGNVEYERKFGHVYLVCATGKSADEMLKILQGRLPNDPWNELRIAAGEQAKITDLRLRKLLDSL